MQHVKITRLNPFEIRASVQPLQRPTITWKPSLNPFEIRASVQPEGASDLLAVGVSIPLKSGHRFNRRGSKSTCRPSLNPFEIRASVQHPKSLIKTGCTRLNPFEIRASVQRGHGLNASHETVSIPLKSGHRFN